MADKLTPTALGLRPSFGFGDRLGTATPGHLEALRTAGGDIKGIFAQQSIREMTRTNRNADQVMQCAADALAAENFTDVWGADADHLKTTEDVDYTADAGFIFYTVDPSDHVDQAADDYDQATLDQKFEEVRDCVPWVDGYVGKKIAIDGCPELEFDQNVVRRAAVKYGRAIAHTVMLATYIKEAAEKRDQPYEVELSVDETDQPTSLAEHYIFADQCLRQGVKLVSLAPRFIGDFEKGVDFKGDLVALEKSLHEHSAIARHLGPYKLSLHSGSDKVSMYAMFGRATQGMFQVKTAGTSYLEALRVVALEDAAQFREIVSFSRDRYNVDKATYHVAATLENVPGLDKIPDAKQLEKTYLECWEDVPEGKGFTELGRQILHCTFGSVLTDNKFGPVVTQIIAENPRTYRDVLADHFARHLRALNAG